MNDRGLLTAIQRFSLNDGPGIRTTVFFKGCNMACAWCHNPETISPKPQLLYYADRCTGCAACIPKCPVNAIRLEGEKVAIDRKLCTNCGLCADVCFSGALEMAGRNYTVDEVMAEILQDKLYYENSGGGVTLSGGEAMMQPDFALAILKRCREEGIATALETNLNYPFSLLEKLLADLDLIMADLKLVDDRRHSAVTARSNELILENIYRLDESGIPFIIRTPVIPGVNDNPQDIAAIADKLSQLKNMKYFELLNFNPLGDSKYLGLDQDNPYHDSKPLKDEALAVLRDEAQQYTENVVLS